MLLVKERLDRKVGFCAAAAEGAGGELETMSLSQDLMAQLAAMGAFQVNTLGS
jgi:hypothetical protein